MEKQQKIRIVKRGIERKYHKGKTSLVGCVLCSELFGNKRDDLMYITDVTTTYNGDTIANAVWRFEQTGSFLSLLVYVYEGDIIAKGAIIDENGKELNKILITKNL